MKEAARRRQQYVFSGWAKRAGKRMAQAVACALLAGCQSMDDVPLVGWGVGQLSGLEVVKGEPFVIARGDRDRGPGFHAFPQLRKLSDDLWMVAFATEGDLAGSSFISVDGQGNPILKTPVLSPMITTNRGATWENRCPEGFGAFVSSNSPVYNWRNGGWRPNQPLFGFIQKRDGGCIGYNMVVLANKEEPGRPGNGIGTLSRSKDGKTWEHPEDCYFRIPDLLLESGEAMRLTSTGVEMEDGSILVATFTSQVKPYNRESTCGYASMIYRSTDDGRTFDLLSVVASGKDAYAKVEGITEPSLVVLPSGEMLCLMRTGAGCAGNRIKCSEPMLMARSKDGGKTWRKHHFVKNGVWPRLLRMSNGVLVCAYGRPGNSLTFSLNDGEFWINTTYLSSFEEPTTSCMDLIEVSPGRLLVVYDLQNYNPGKKWYDTPGEGVNAVMGCFVDVHYNGGTNVTATAGGQP